MRPLNGGRFAVTVVWRLAAFVALSLAGPWIAKTVQTATECTAAEGSCAAISIATGTLLRPLILVLLALALIRRTLRPDGLFLAAFVLLDACVRLLPGVMGAASSGEEESFEGGLLEYPQYTRPLEWEGRRIPEVLRSGDHARIAAWRRRQAEEDTRLRRPDLIERHGCARRPPPSGAQRREQED